MAVAVALAVANWPIPPARLILYVGRPPPTGGQALLSDSRAALRHLREEFPDVLAELEQRSVRYKHFYPDRNAFGGTVITSWQDSLAKGSLFYTNPAAAVGPGQGGARRGAWGGGGG